MKLFPVIVLAVGLLLARRAIAAPQQDTTQPEPWTHETVKVNGVKLHYVTQGKGQVVLFLHGFPEFWYAWKDQIPFFGAQFQAIAVDMRGYNLSEKPEKVSDYAMPLLIEDVRALLKTVSKNKKAILVAHDWGGAIAWAYAAMYPETLEKLVIINAPHPNVFSRELKHNPAQQKASGYMNLFRSPQAEMVLSMGNFVTLAAGVFGSASRSDAFSEEDKKRYKEAWAQPGALTGGLNYYRAANLGPPSSERTEEEGKPDTSTLAALPPLTVKVPTLVIWGEKDTALLTGNLEGLDKYVPNLTIKRIPNGSHWVVHEEPDLINRTILEFLTKR